jgi:hypothetical protein
VAEHLIGDPPVLTTSGNLLLELQLAILVNARRIRALETPNIQAQSPFSLVEYSSHPKNTTDRAPTDMNRQGMVLSLCHDA